MAIIGANSSCYFTHDANAREDARLMKLRRKHGYEGIGIYWTLIEILRQSSDYEYLYEPELLADLLRIPEKSELIKSIVQDFDLFEYDIASSDYFSSGDLNENMEFMESKRQKFSAGGKTGSAITNFKLHGTIPEQWTDEDINAQWQELTKAERNKLSDIMAKPENEDHRKRLNEALSTS